MEKVTNDSTLLIDVQEMAQWVLDRYWDAQRPSDEAPEEVLSIAVRHIADKEGQLADG